MSCPADFVVARSSQTMGMTKNRTKIPITTPTMVRPLQPVRLPRAGGPSRPSGPFRSSAGRPMSSVVMGSVRLEQAAARHEDGRQHEGDEEQQQGDGGRAVEVVLLERV